MYQNERLQKIMEIIGKKKSMTVKELETLTFVSKSTLRRDLIELEKEKKIVRNFGEVELVKDSNVEFGYNIRKRDHEEEKKYIASIANDFIGDNFALLMDSSSSVTYLEPYIEKHLNMIVITNGLHLALYFNDVPEVSTFLAGGN